MTWWEACRWKADLSTIAAKIALQICGRGEGCCCKVFVSSYVWCGAVVVLMTKTLWLAVIFKASNISKGT